jgi:hypothetical protein
LTCQLAQRFGKPLLIVDLSQDPQASQVRDWIRDHAVRVLNVAGPRESSAPGIALEAQAFLTDVLRGG